MALFVIALATILINELIRIARLDQRTFRALSDGIQADYALKSALNLSIAILELPNLRDAVDATWQGEYWYQAASFPNIPIKDFSGELRLLITDELSKFPLNALGTRDTAALELNGPHIGSAARNFEQAISKEAIVWREWLRDFLLLHLKFPTTNRELEKGRTVGNIAFGAEDQVTEIVRWFHSQIGAERLNKELFPGPPFKRLSDLLRVPGITLERLSALAPYVNFAPFSAATAQVNINTVSPELLQAMGIKDEVIRFILSSRAQAPIPPDLIKELEENDPRLKNKLTTKSSRFSVYARIIMPSVTRWARAEISATGGGSRRVAKFEGVELY